MARRAPPPYFYPLVLGGSFLLLLLSARAKTGKWPTIIKDGKLNFGAPTTRFWDGKRVKFMSGRRYSTARKNLAEYARQVAVREGIPPDGFVVQLWVESAFNPQAESVVAARGIGQFMPLTGRDYGLVTGITDADAAEYTRRYKAAGKLERRSDESERAWKNRKYKGKREAAHWLLAQPGVQDNRDDARASINAAARYMKRLYGKLGNWAHAAGGYNCGRGCMSNRLRKGTLAPKETQRYMTTIGPYYQADFAPHLVSAEMKAAHPWPTATT